MASKKKSSKHSHTSVPPPKAIESIVPPMHPTAEIPSSHNRLILIWKISLAVVLLLMLGMSFSYGLSGDEVDMNEYGKAILRFYTSFGSDQTVFNMPDQFDRDHILKYYGGFYDTICAIITRFSPLDLYTTRHLLNAFVGFLAIFFASKIIKKIIGTRAAIIGIWIMFLSPFFLGHAMNNPKDIPMAAFWVMALYGMIRLFDDLPNAKWKDYAYAILPIGFTIASRVGGILLIPEMFVLLALLWYFRFRKEGPGVMYLVKRFAIVAGSGYLVGCLLWPFGLIDPINNPLFALKEMTNLSVGMKQIFEGVEMFSTELPSYYLPKIFTMTNTIAFLVGLVLMLAFLYPFRKNKNAALLYFVAFTAFFPFFYIIYSKSNVFHAWRHTLFIFPSAIVCASFGWNELVRILEKKKLQLVGLGGLVALLLLPLFFIVSTFPNTNTYYNELYGGVKKAYGDYEVDFYYNSLKESADYFIKNVLPKQKKGDSVILATNAVHLLPHYFPKDAKVKFDYLRYRERNTKDWDYAIMHIALIPREDMIQELWIPDNSTLYKAQVKGKTLSAVIKRNSKDDILGMQYLEQANVDSAIYSFENYLKTDEKNTAILNRLADAYMRAGQKGKAQNTLVKSLTLNPSDIESNYFYGMLMVETQNYADAQKRFALVLQANPNFVQAYYYLGLSQMGMGNYQAAIQSLNTAAQVPELQKNCYKYIGDCYARLGNQQEAARFYQMAGQ